jgi:hypothetical protein
VTITRVNSASISGGASATSCTATIPGGTGIQAGDLIIVCAGSQTGHTTNGISAQDNVNATNYTTILETELGSSSTRWMQTFAFVTPLAIADGSTITVTGYATATNTECSVDIFRGVTGTISRTVVSASQPLGTSCAISALASAPPAGDLVLTFCEAGSGTLTPSAAFTKGSSGTTGASTAIGFVLSADGSSTYASTWTLGTQNTSAGQTVSFSSGATAYPAIRQPIQARFPQAPIGASAFRGRIASNKGAPVHNPQAGPVFRPARAAIRARILPGPYQLGRPGLIYGSVAKPGSSDISYGSGRCLWSPGAPVHNPQPGPVFRQKTIPVKAQFPPAQFYPKGRIGSSPTKAVQIPGRGPPVYALQGEVRSQLPQPHPRAGRITSSPGAPVQNPQAGPLFEQAQSPIQAKILRNAPRGRVYSTPGSLVTVIPPHPGPPVYPLGGPVRARLPQQPFLSGRISSDPGAPVRNPQPGPSFEQATTPARAVIPRTFSKGRAYSNPGAPVQNPQQGPAFRQKTFPVQATDPLPRRGRVYGISTGAPVGNLSAGPVFRQATAPVRARRPLPPRGRTYGNPGGPVVNPVPLLAGPPFFPKNYPARIRPGLPPRGRMYSNAGAPVRNPQAGPVFRSATSPIRVRNTQVFSRGTVNSDPGAPVNNPVFPAPVYPLKSPVRAHPVLPPRGRISSNPGAPVRNPAPQAGSPFFARTSPVRVHPVLPPRGRIASSKGAPVRNPQAGPKVYPLHGPVGNAYRAPGPFRKGSVTVSARSPVSNPPSVALIRFRLGVPGFGWVVGNVTKQWQVP